MRKKMPRREFLKVAGTTALAVSAAALTGCSDTPEGNGSSSSSSASSGAASSGSSSSGSTSSGSTGSGKDEADENGIIWKMLYINGTNGLSLHGYDPAGKEPAGDIKLPSVWDGYPVVGILESFLKGNKKIRSVEIPDSVTSLESRAFEQCTNLQSVRLSKNIGKIGGNAFKGTALTVVEIPNSVKYIGYGAFEDCTSLHTVVLGAGVETIEMMAFRNTALESVQMPKSLRTIGESAFERCTKLTAVTLNEGLTTLGVSVFYGAPISTITLPKTLRNMNGSVFGECKNLKTVTIEDGVTVIGASAFVTSGLESVVRIPKSVDKVGKLAFYMCKLKQVIFEANDGTKIKEIGEMAFGDNRTMETAVLPDGLQEIAQEMFRYCDAMSRVYIPASVRTIRKDAFYGAKGLEKIYFGGTQAQWDAMVIESNDRGYWDSEESKKCLKNAEVICNAHPQDALN